MGTERWVVLGIVVLAAGCRGSDAEVDPVPEDAEPYEELTIAADTAEEAFQSGEGVGVIAVQGGARVEGPFTATGSLQNNSPVSPSPGAVTLTATGGGTEILITLNQYDPGGRLQATLVRGLCGENGTVVEVLEPVIEVAATGVSNYQGVVPVATRSLFDGEHSLKIVPAPAEMGPQDNGAVLACANLQESEAAPEAR